MNEISLTINKYFFRLKRNCIGAIIFAMKLYLTEKALAEIKTDRRADRQTDIRTFNLQAKQCFVVFIC